jgi:hypothetical protein
VAPNSPNVRTACHRAPASVKLNRAIWSHIPGGVSGGSLPSAVPFLDQVRPATVEATVRQTIRVTRESMEVYVRAGNAGRDFMPPPHS